MVFQDTIKLAPQGKGASDITGPIRDIIRDSKIKTGSCQLFVHNSQSRLLIHDTVDEATKEQTVDFLAQLAPGRDDSVNLINDSMEAIPASMYTAVTQTTIAFPVSRGKPLLGIWQGIFLWERTTEPKERILTITIIGE